MPPGLVVTRRSARTAPRSPGTRARSRRTTPADAPGGNCGTSGANAAVATPLQAAGPAAESGGLPRDHAAAERDQAALGELHPREVRQPPHQRDAVLPPARRTDAPELDADPSAHVTPVIRPSR